MIERFLHRRERKQFLLPNGLPNIVFPQLLLENDMAKFHFLEDYERHVAELLARHPLDEAMSLAVGGNWDGVGNINSDLLIHCGLRDGMAVLDFGCGSGRVATKLAQKVQLASFIGIDVIPELLAYARTVSPPDYVFLLNPSLKVPVENSAFDFVYAFSVFTHLLQTEILLYTHDIFQKLKPGGLFLFSFLEMDKHWTIFVNDAVRHLEYGQPTPHLNMFLSRHQIEEIAEKIGFKVVRYIESDGDVYSIGQTVVMFKKP